MVLKTLKNGSSELASNSGKILDGIGSLANGSNELYKGANKLKTEGLDKLSSEGNTLISDIDGAMEVKDKLIDASKSYNNFSGIDESMDGSVKFVMKVQENDKNDSTQENSSKKSNSNISSKEDSNFMTWIKSKFNK